MKNLFAFALILLVASCVMAKPRPNPDPQPYIDLIGGVVNSGFDIAKQFMLEAVDEAAHAEQELKNPMKFDCKLSLVKW